MSRLGMAAAERDLSGEGFEPAARAVARMGSLGTPTAIERLAEVLESGPRATDPRLRVLGARALAPHAAQPAARRALVRIVTGAGLTTERGSDLDLLGRRTAALALAAAGTRPALTTLANLARQQGPSAWAAIDALVAHPPRDLGEILRARGAPTVEFVELLERLGDQRAFTALRSFVQRGSPEVASRAALTLTRLGDFETVELARHWLRPENTEPTRWAATRILVLAHAPDAASALAAWLSDPKGVDRAVELAASAHVPGLDARLGQLLRSANADRAASVTRALSLSRAATAVKHLEEALQRPAQRTAAALALATSTAPGASDALERALGRAELRRTAILAATTRWLTLDEPTSGLDEAIHVLSSSRDAADRAVVAFARAVRAPERIAQEVDGEDPVALRAALAAAPLAPPDALHAAASRLEHEQDPVTREALAIALVADDAAHRVSTEALLRLIGDGGGASALAARALASRDDPRYRDHVEALLASDVPRLRAHSALGLGGNRDASSAGLLAAAYRFETSPEVRRAIARALGSHPTGVGRQTLQIAATLDPDADVRSISRAILAGHRPPNLGRGRAVLWVTLADPAGQPPSPRVATVTPVGGVALPVVSLPDGTLVVAGLPAEGVDVSLAIVRARGEGRSPKGVAPRGQQEAR